MLLAKIQKVPSHPRYPGPGPTFVIDLNDNETPQGRSMSYRIPFSWDGLHALKEALDIIISRKSDVSTGQEKKGSNEYVSVQDGKNESRIFTR